jgi:hypothetical protein
MGNLSPEVSEESVIYFHRTEVVINHFRRSYGSGFSIANQAPPEALMKAMQKLIRKHVKQFEQHIEEESSLYIDTLCHPGSLHRSEQKTSDAPI